METQKTPKVNDVFPNWIMGQGIFGALQNFPVPWASPDIHVALDIDYHGGHSGRKIISPLVSAVMSGDILSESEKTMIATSAMAIYGTNWAKEYATLSAQYDPIQNYKMVEELANDTRVIEYGRNHTRTDNLEHTKTGTETQAPNTTETRTDNLNHGKTGTETQTPNTTETRSPTLTRNVTNSVYGFNSSTASPADMQAETQGGNEQVTRTGSDTLTHNVNETQTGTQQTQRTGQETLTHNVTDADTGTQTYRDSGEDTETRNYTLTREGNIGVTTSQQMLESERNLWLWNFFRDIVYPDIDKLLSLAVY